MTVILFVMPAKFDHSLDEQTLTHSGETHPHLGSNCTLKLISHNITKELEDVKGPLEDMPDNVEIDNFGTQQLFRPFAACHCIRFESKFCMMKACLHSYKYLWQLAFKQREQSYSNFK